MSRATLITLRRALLGPLVAALCAACGPKVDPRSPFDEDDPRAGMIEEPAAPVAEGAVVLAPASTSKQAPVVREGTIARAALVARLDAQPGEVLRCVEVAAVEQGGKFAGWRLVRFVGGCALFAGVDLAVGDVLVGVNGRAIVKPSDLSDLWQELYAADAIVAELRRDGAPVVLRYAVTGGPAVAPAAVPPGAGAGSAAVTPAAPN